MALPTLTRALKIPDVLRLSRYEKAPQYGPSVLFFSGGTALNETSKILKRYTHNSIHMVTPFDSGGSSAVLRDTFDLLAVGDLRSRLMALADDTISGHPEVFNLFAYRLSHDYSQDELRDQLKAMANGKDPMVKQIKNPMRKLICNHIAHFIEAMPKQFNLQGASIGNLILVAGYLTNKRELDPVLFLFSKLVNVLGHVRPIVNDNFHLGAELQDGTTLIGQHLITGKETPAITCAIKQIFLTRSKSDPEPVSAQITKKKRKLIEQAELICYPPGSFYSSLLANLMVKGVTKAISDNKNPKVYIPSLGVDPEICGASFDDMVLLFCERLVELAPKNTELGDLLDFILIDPNHGPELKKDTRQKLKDRNVEILESTLITSRSDPYYDPHKLVVALLSLT